MANKEWIIFLKILEHDKVTRITMITNDWLSKLMFAFYYMVIPSIDFAMIFIIYETSLFIRLITIFVTIVNTFFLFSTSYLLSTIIFEAHKSYAVLYSLIFRNRLRLKIKFKILSLIERLAGPPIGIYCYDLFPYNNFEFYLFIVNCISNFILFMDLFG